MARLISASINLSKIDKSKITVSKNGDSYYNITISVNDNPNDYGQDVSIYDSQSKEQREAKEPKKFLGNGKTFWNGEQKQVTQTSAPSQQQSDLPF